MSKKIKKSASSKLSSKLSSKQSSRFSIATLNFLVKAHKQKNPDWLDKNMNEYEEVVKTPFVSLAEHIRSELLPLAADYHFPHKGIGRLKRPSHKVKGGEALFKDWLSIIAAKPATSRFESNPHLFFGMFPNEKQKIIIAGGMWYPSSKQLRAIKEAIYKDSTEFHTLLNNKAFKQRFKEGFFSEDKVSRIPRGFDKDHSDIDWLMLKKFVVIKEYSIKDFSSANFKNEVVQDFKQALKLNRLLEKAIAYQWP